jgi:hypothetical protein
MPDEPWTVICREEGTLFCGFMASQGTGTLESKDSSQRGSPPTSKETSVSLGPIQRNAEEASHKPAGRGLMNGTHERIAVMSGEWSDRWG